MVIMLGARHCPDLDSEIHEHVILGIDVEDASTRAPPDRLLLKGTCPNHAESGCQGDIIVAMALPVTKALKTEMDGDGGMRIRSTENDMHYVFKPVNLQALWVSHSCLNSAIENAHVYNIFPGSRNHHTWAGCYTARIPSFLDKDDTWEDTSAIESQVSKTDIKDVAVRNAMDAMLFRMREIIMTADLDNTSCVEIRKQLEKEFNLNLAPYKRFIDEQIVKVFGQSTEPPSQIFDYLYLGNEWNASNLPQLRALGITHVLNVTMEIANFFPHELVYKTIRIRDVESSYLQQHWDETYHFVKDAKRYNKRVFVHCRMGVSRSASCVIAYIMKEYSMSLSVAQEYVTMIRDCVNPNPGFVKQLEEYNGILEARYNNVYGIHAKRLARCPQISEQKLITERWLKEYGQTPQISQDYCGAVREIDGVEKVSEWMALHQSLQDSLNVQEDDELQKDEETLLADAGEDVSTPEGEEDLKVLKAGLLDKLNKDEVESDSLQTSETTQTSTIENSLSEPSSDDKVNTPTGREHLSADGPFSACDLENEVEEVTGGVVRDCEIKSRVKDAVVHRIRSNPSFRRRTSTSGGVVRSCVVQIEVRSEAESYTPFVRDRIRSAGAAVLSSKRSKKTQSLSLTEFAANNEQMRPARKKKEHAKKICASIKKIIERLLSPRPQSDKTREPAADEIARAMELEGASYNNRMSAPLLAEGRLYTVLPKRRCQSGADFPIPSGDS